MSGPPDDYGKRNPAASIVDLNRRMSMREPDPPLPQFIRSRSEALRDLERDVGGAVKTINQEAAVQEPRPDPQPEPNPLDMVKRLLAAMPVLEAIEVADGIIAAGDFKDKPPTGVELAVAMAKFGAGK